MRVGYPTRLRSAFANARAHYWDIPSIFHVKKAQSNFQKSKIAKLKTVDGREVHAEPEITQEILNYFTSIFKNQASPDNSLGDIFLSGVRGILLGNPSSLLTAPLSAGKFKVALHACKPNKALGTDGIPWEFYFKF